MISWLLWVYVYFDSWVCCKGKVYGCGFNVRFECYLIMLEMIKLMIVICSDFIDLEIYFE